MHVLFNVCGVWYGRQQMDKRQQEVRAQGRVRPQTHLTGSLQVTGVHSIEAEVSEVPAYRLRLPQPRLWQGGIHSLTWRHSTNVTTMSPLNRPTGYTGTRFVTPTSLTQADVRLAAPGSALGCFIGSTYLTRWYRISWSFISGTHLAAACLCCTASPHCTETASKDIAIQVHSHSI